MSSHLYCNAFCNYCTQRPLYIQKCNCIQLKNITILIGVTVSGITNTLQEHQEVSFLPRLNGSLGWEGHLFKNDNQQHSTGGCIPYVSTAALNILATALCLEAQHPTSSYHPGSIYPTVLCKRVWECVTEQFNASIGILNTGWRWKMARCCRRCRYQSRVPSTRKRG